MWPAKAYEEMSEDERQANWEIYRTTAERIAIAKKAELWAAVFNEQEAKRTIQ